jgi:hypothetical protein
LQDSQNNASESERSNIKNARLSPTMLIIKQNNHRLEGKKMLNFNLQSRRKATPQGFNTLISNDF